MGVSGCKMEFRIDLFVFKSLAQLEKWFWVGNYIEKLVLTETLGHSLATISRCMSDHCLAFEGRPWFDLFSVVC